MVQCWVFTCGWICSGAWHIVGCSSVDECAVEHGTLLGVYWWMGVQWSMMQCWVSPVGWCAVEHDAVLGVHLWVGVRWSIVQR